MKFFKPEDFLGSAAYGGVFDYIENKIDQSIIITNIANDKLEREGKIVEGNVCLLGHDYSKLELDKKPFTHKALLINIEPIEKCTHPSEKVTQGKMLEYNPPRLDSYFYCECGVRVKPLTFQEVK